MKWINYKLTPPKKEGRYLLKMLHAGYIRYGSGWYNGCWVLDDGLAVYGDLLITHWSKVK